MEPADILVIDDSPTVRRMIELILSQQGHRVRTSEDGEAGLGAARVQPPDLILVDYMMPNLNGAQFCEQARQDPALQNVPIILISSKGQVIGDVFEKRFGVVESFTKPFEPDELIQKIAAVLPKRAARAAEEDAAEAVLETEVGGDLALERLDRLFRDYFHSRFPSLLKRLVADTLREQGVTPPGAMTLNGRIGDLALPDVLNLFASTAATGRLSVISAEAFSEIFVEDGLFVFATISRRTGRHHLLTDVLRDELGIEVDPALVIELTAESQESGRPIGQLLLDRKVIDKDTLGTALATQARSALNAALEVEEGEFSFDSEPLPKSLADIEFRLPMMTVLMDGLRMLDEKQHAASRLPDDGAVLSRYIANDYASDLELDGRELRVFLAIDGKKNLTQIAAELGCSTLELKQTCVPLIRSGMVRVPQSRARAAAPAAA